LLIALDDFDTGLSSLSWLPHCQPTSSRSTAPSPTRSGTEPRRAAIDDFPAGNGDWTSSARVHCRVLQELLGPADTCEVLQRVSSTSSGDGSRVPESVVDAVLLVADDGLIRWANGAAFEMFGYEPVALVGQSVDILVPESLRKDHAGHRRAFVADPVDRPLGTGVELAAVRADGSQFRIDISLSPLRHSDGVITVAVVRDLTAQSRWRADVERLARLVLDGCLDSYIATDSRSLVLGWNTTAERMFGWTRDEALGRPLPELIIPERLRAEASQSWVRFGSGGESPDFIGQTSEAIACRRDGTEFPDEMSITTIGEGDRVSFHAFHRDISERKTSQEQMALAATVLASSPDGIAALDLDRNIVVWNPAMGMLYGYPVAEVIGQPFLNVIPRESTQQMRAHLDTVYGAGQTVSYVQPRLRKDHSPFTISGLLAPILGANGHVIGVLNNARDVTEQLAAEQELRDATRQLQAIIDNTTAAISVRNRDFRYTLANDAFRQSVGLPPDTSLVGRPDTEVLAAEAIARLRVSDYRVLAGESMSEEETVNRGDQQRFVLSQRFPLTDADGRAYAIAEVATDITESKRAELELRERNAWEDHIRSAVTEGRLLVYAQPVIDLATGALWGEELLVRMQGGHGPEDVVPPDGFLPQAERFGLMPIIDRFMIAQAVELARAGRRISVNISASSLQTPALAEAITADLADCPQAAPHLTFEITETAALASPGVAQAFSDRLAELGAGLALDDFGTGYGSFTELRNLNLQTLKIDQSFVQNLASDTEDQRVVQLIIHIGKLYGISTTAEGVADTQSLALLREYGADRAQGYLIGKPAPLRPVDPPQHTLPVPRQPDIGKEPAGRSQPRRQEPWSQTRSRPESQTSCPPKPFSATPHAHQ
jgi:PAS domain S-box-containing protein